MVNEAFSVFKEMRKYIREEGIMDIEATSPTDLKKIQYEELLFKIIRTIRRCILFNDVQGLVNEVKLLEITVDPYISEVRREIIRDIDSRMNTDINTLTSIGSNKLKKMQTDMTIFRYSFNKLEMILLAMSEERIFFLTELYLIMVMLHYSDIIKGAITNRFVFMNEVLMLKAVIFPFIRKDQVQFMDQDLELVTNNYRYLSENGQIRMADQLIDNFSYRLLKYLVEVMNKEGFLYEQSQSVNLALAVMPYEETKPFSPEEKKATYVMNSIYSRLHYKNQNWLGCIVGQTGSGKTYCAISLAKKLDPTFHIGRIAFSFKEFMDILMSEEMKEGTGKFIMWDESGVDLDSRKFYSTVNILANRVLQTFRHQNIGVIFTVPDQSFVDKRSRILFHTIIETKTILRSKGLVVTDWRESHRSASSDKIFHWRPRLNFDGKRFKVKAVLIPRPEKELAKEYEKKKKAFTKKLNEETQQIIEQEKDIKEKVSFNELQKIASSIVQEGIETYSTLRNGRYIFNAETLEIRENLRKSDAKKLKLILEETMNG